MKKSCEKGSPAMEDPAKLSTLTPPDPAPKASTMTSGTQRTLKKCPGRRLEEESYYHGMLPRADVNDLLKKNGDFVVRNTRQTDDGERTDAISIMWGGRVRHLIPKRSPTNDNFYIDQLEFASVGELVRYHHTTATPLSRKVPAVLQNPVAPPLWELRKHQVVSQKKLGEGAFGEVFQGLFYLGGKSSAPLAVAIKVAHAGSLTKSQLQEFMAEARLMRDYHHPNIVQFYGVVVESEPVMIVMELVKDGSLDSHLRKYRASQYDRIHYCLDAAKGLEYLHGKKCIHRDVAARNCLLGGGRVKISDFGLCREAKVHYKMDPKKKVPIRWLAPETLSTATYSFKSDVFSFGVMVWEVYSDGAEPYPGMTNLEVHKGVRSGYRMELPMMMPKDMQLVVNHCWLETPDQRPTFTKIASKLDQIARHTGRRNDESVML